LQQKKSTKKVKKRNDWAFDFLEFGKKFLGKKRGGGLIAAPSFAFEAE
jgi:hypothetical protein